MTVVVGRLSKCLPKDVNHRTEHNGHLVMLQVVTTFEVIKSQLPPQC